MNNNINKSSQVKQYRYSAQINSDPLINITLCVLNLLVMDIQWLAKCNSGDMLFTSWLNYCTSLRGWNSDSDDEFKKVALYLLTWILSLIMFVLMLQLMVK